MGNIETKEAFLMAMRRFEKTRMHLFLDHHAQELTRSEFFCIAMIRNYDKETGKGACVSVLAEKMRVQAPAISRMLKGLEKRELIERTTDPDDRRNVLVNLTDEGRMIWDRMSKHLEGYMNWIIEELGEEDMMTLISLLDRLSSIVEEGVKKEAEKLC